MRKREKLALAVIILSALNMGFWGWYQFDFIAWFFHSNTSWTSRFFYSISGFSALFFLYFQLTKIKALQRFFKKMFN